MVYNSDDGVEDVVVIAGVEDDDDEEAEETEGKVNKVAAV